MNRYAELGLKSKILPGLLGLAAGTLLLLSGAAFAPSLVPTQKTTPLPKFQIPAPIQSVPKVTIKKHSSESSLAQRLNSRYRLGRSLSASV